MPTKIKKKTRSDAIRECLRSLPASKRSPTEVMKSLRSRGIKVTRNHVSVVKSLMSRSRGISAGEDLVLAKKFLDKVGGQERAQSLISLVSRIIR
jgi:hypothetical protein